MINLEEKVQQNPIGPDAMRLIQMSDLSSLKPTNGEVANGQLVNKQLYANSEQSNSISELDYLDSPECLHNAKLPQLNIIHEKPWHRAVAYMLAQGFTQREVSARFGKTEPWISQLARQPWFQQRVVDELKEGGIDKIKALLDAETLPSLEKVTYLRDHAKNESVQLTAAFDIINRTLGKPTQKVETVNTTDIKMTLTNIQKIDQEIDKLQQALDVSTASVPVDPRVGSVGSDEPALESELSKEVLP